MDDEEAAMQSHQLIKDAWSETASQKKVQTITRKREGTIDVKKGDGATKKMEFVQTPKHSAKGIEDEKKSGEVVKTPQTAAIAEGREPLTKKQKADQAAKAQAAKLQKEAKANDPMEKAKKYLQKAPTSIRELNSALNEAQKSAVTKNNMPSRFLQVYTHQFKEHVD